VWSLGFCVARACLFIFALGCARYTRWIVSLAFSLPLSLSYIQTGRFQAAAGQEKEEEEDDENEEKGRDAGRRIRKESSLVVVVLLD